jgi:hypothetical protein
MEETRCCRKITNILWKHSGILLFKEKSLRFVLKWGEKIEKENDEMFDSWDRRRWI